MPHPLAERVRAVERRVRRLEWWHAACGCFLWATAIVMAAVALDYVLRIHDAGVRWIWSLAVAAALGWALWRWIVPIRRRPPAPVEVAQRIERRFPQIRGRLSSAVAFLSQSPSDPTAGSLDLRRAVVAETESLSADLDFQEVIDPRQPRRFIVAAAVMAIAALGLALASPSLVSLGAVRLAMPWSKVSWPARHALALVSPPRVVAKGDDVEIQVVDRNGELPEDVELQVRELESGRSQTHAMKRLGDQMIYRLDHVDQPLAYRAVGGDDYGMEWTTLQVASPAKVATLSIEVTPPAYSGWPKEQGGKLVRALAGSHLALRGTADKPIKSASLKAADGRTLPVRVAIAKDGRSFFAPADTRTPWLADQSGDFWCEVADESGLPTGRQEHIELQVITDAPPTISWESPADHTFVTPRALVPIRGLVKDDLAVARVELRYLRPDASDQGEQVVELYVGKTPAALASVGQGAARGPSGQSLALDATWDLALIPGLSDGSVLAVRLVADDFKHQQTAATVRRLTIISEEELESRVVQEQSSILTQLAEVLRLQRQVRDQTAELEIRLKETGQFAPQDLSYLQSAELNQRQVQRLLTDPQDGVEPRILALLDELAHNRVSSQAASDRMKELLTKVRQIGKDELAGISHELTSALKSAQAGAERGEGVPPAKDAPNCGADDAASVQQSLGAAGASQERVIAALEALLGDLSQWDSFSRLAREVGQIREGEQALAGETDQLRLEMAASDSPDSLANRASSRQLSRRQIELARRYEKLQTRMDEMRVRLGQSDPLVAATLADALDAARRLAVAGRMRSAATDLMDVRPGPAHETQQGVISGLGELLDLLSRRRDAELARTAQSLQRTSADLNSIRERQQALRRELHDAAGDPAEASRARKLERLSPQAQKLAEEVRELARKLERLQARRAAETGSQAAAVMDQAAQAAAADQGAAAEEHAAAAQDLLEETRRQLQQQIEQAEQDLLREQLARFEQHLQGLIARQKNVIQETTRLEEFRGQQNGALSAAQQATLRGIAGEQRLLADESQRLGTTIQAAAAFVLGLDGARQHMLAAAERLDAGETGTAIKVIEEDALRRLTQLRDALKPDEGASQEPQDDVQQPPGQNGNAPALSIQNLAELKLLKLMQEEVQRQTAELEKIREQAGELNAEQLQRLEGLASEQGKLADMVLNMIQSAARRPDDSLPESLKSKEKQPAKGDNKNQAGSKSLDEELLKELEGK